MRLNHRVIPLAVAGAMACVQPASLPQPPHHQPLAESASVHNGQHQIYYSEKDISPNVPLSSGFISAFSIRKASDFADWENFLLGVSGKKPVPYKNVFFSPRTTLHSKCGDAYGCYDGSIHIFSDSLNAVQSRAENCSSIHRSLLESPFAVYLHEQGHHFDKKRDMNSAEERWMTQTAAIVFEHFAAVELAKSDPQLGLSLLAGHLNVEFSKAKAIALTDSDAREKDPFGGVLAYQTIYALLGSGISTYEDLWNFLQTKSSGEIKSRALANADKINDGRWFAHKSMMDLGSKYKLTDESSLRAISATESRILAEQLDVQNPKPIPNNRHGYSIVLSKESSLEFDRDKLHFTFVQDSFSRFRFELILEPGFLKVVSPRNDVTITRNSIYEHIRTVLGTCPPVPLLRLSSGRDCVIAPGMEDSDPNSVFRTTLINTAREHFNSLSEKIRESDKDAADLLRRHSSNLDDLCSSR